MMLIESYNDLQDILGLRLLVFLKKLFSNISLSNLQVVKDLPLYELRIWRVIFF